MLRRVGARWLCRRVLPTGMVCEGDFSAPATAPKFFLTRGTATLPDGRRFEGTFDAATGAPRKGTRRTDGEGDVYVGEYNAAWQSHGTGEAFLGDGTRYTGRFAEDDFVEGTVTIPDGLRGDVTFTGTLKDGAFQHGTLRQRDYTYTGAFEDNAPHGPGKLEFHSGAVHEGSFFRGKLHGDKGKMKLENGDVYLGSFVDGRITKGELRTATYTHEGSFNEFGQAEGPGVQFRLDVSPKLTFEGMWTAGVLWEGRCVSEHGEVVDTVTGPIADQLHSRAERTMAGAVDVAMAQEVLLARQRREALAGDRVLATEGGKPVPSDVELGYERTFDERRQLTDGDAQRAFDGWRRLAESVERRLPATDATKEPIALGEAIGADHGTAGILDGQLAAFRRRMSAKESAAAASGAEGGAGRRHVDMNEAWATHYPTRAS